MVLQLSGYHLGRFVPGFTGLSTVETSRAPSSYGWERSVGGLLGGGGRRSRYCSRSMGAKKNVDMTHLQWNCVATA